MRESSDYLIRVLRGFVQNEDPGPFGGDWRQLYALSAMHSVTGILGHSVMTWPHEDSAPVAQQMRRTCLQTMAFFSRRADAMQRLSERLSAEGIDHLHFKGYVVRRYYPIPELRTFGDIDFLIRPEDREACDAIMRAEGFAVQTNWEPVYSYLRGSEFYEIHTKLLETRISERTDYREYFTRIWEHAERQAEHVFVPKPEYHLLYLLTHIAKHIYESGAGIRMYLDIALLLKHFGGSLDWNWFCGELETLRFQDFTNLVFTFTERAFGVQSPIPLRPVDAETYRDFVDFTMSGGTFGKFGRDSSVIRLRNQALDGDEVRRGKTILKQIFPPASQMVQRYTYLQGRPWLYPAAWVHRILKNKNILGSRVQQMQDIATADTEEVMKLKRIYQEIGL